MDDMGGVLWNIGNGTKLGVLLINVAILMDRRNMGGGISHIMPLWSNHS
jgi:hypothetical protein